MSDTTVLPADDFPAQNIQAQMLRTCVVGCGAVAWKRHQLIVTGKGATWQLLAKELIKGTAELICLHGLSQLDDDMYQRIINITDRIDLEPWMIQSGGELWRRLLAALPEGWPAAKVLMHLARSPAGILESALQPVIEQSDKARDHLARLAE